ncbi:hypothetical protein ACWEKM_16250 [Streptomyces sp. NPDC004752]
MALFGVMAAVLAIGLLLLLVRNTAGRWLIVAGGIRKQDVLAVVQAKDLPHSPQ